MSEVDELLPRPTPSDPPPRTERPSIRKGRFVVAYLATLNQYQAALEAKCKPGAAAKQQAARWMNDPWVRRQIVERMERRNRELEIDAKWVMHELVLAYKTSIAELLAVEEKPDGRHGLVAKFDLDNAPPEVVARVTKIRIDEKKGSISVELPDKLKLLELIGKLVDVSAFEDRMSVELRNSEDLVSRVLRGRQRVAEAAPAVRLRIASRDGHAVEDDEGLEEGAA